MSYDLIKDSLRRLDLADPGPRYLAREVDPASLAIGVYKNMVA
jgi:hypothetical protein